MKRQRWTIEMLAALGCVVLGVVLLGKAAATYNGFGTLLAAGIALGAVALLVVLRTAFSSIGGREIGHSHAGPRRAAARHEAGHVVVTRAVGGHVSSAWIRNDGSGLVRGSLPDNPEKEIAALLAGQLAEGSSVGAGWDNAAINSRLKRLPANQRAGVLSRAKGRARSALFWRGGQVTSIENRLYKNGSL